MKITRNSAGSYSVVLQLDCMINGEHRTDTVKATLYKADSWSVWAYAFNLDGIEVYNTDYIGSYSDAKAMLANFENGFSYSF